MFEVAVVMDFSAAHNLRGYKGKCETLHGHNWKVEVTLQARRTDKIGMAEDFGAIKAVLGEVLEGLDHRYLNELAPFKKTNPTSENIAQWVFQQMSRRGRRGLKVARVKVWETERSSATYFES